MRQARVLAEGYFQLAFSNSFSTIMSPSFVSMLVYRLEMSKVAKMQFSGTFPNSHNLLMKSVVSFMWDGSFSAKGLRNSST